MRTWKLLCVVVVTTQTLCGCAWLGRLGCEPRCQADTRSSSSVVDFLYPNAGSNGGRGLPPADERIPELRLPLRVGLAFLPPRGGENARALDAAHQNQLLERIRQHFSERSFVSEIVIIPDYYLASGLARGQGFAGLEGVQRLYGVDLMALVSYDQAVHADENGWSLGYLTIVGAFVLKGDRHDISTLVDLAVVDPVSRSLVLRAGGVDVRHGNTTLVDADRETREAGVQAFSAATDQMIGHFDAALARFEADVRAGKANVRVVNKSNPGSRSHGGGGSLNWTWITLLGLLVAVRGAACLDPLLLGRDRVGRIQMRIGQ
jgi:rhombotail lipoprotein